MSQITVIVKKPGEAAYVTQIDNGLEGMSAVVGGAIERVMGWAVGLPDSIDVWFNEDGKHVRLAPNLHIENDGGEPGALVGVVFFASRSRDDSETTSLPDHLHPSVFALCQTHAWKDVTS